MDENDHFRRMEAAYTHASTIRPDPSLVAQANIYVTHQTTRCVRVLVLPAILFAHAIILPSLLRCYIYKARQHVLQRSRYTELRVPSNSIQDICEDLLSIMRRIPLECLAVNGRTVIVKG